MYRLYLEGKGFDSIARTLTKEGFPTPSQVAAKVNAGLYWQGTTIKKILINPHYTGDLVLCRETTLSVTNKVRTEVAKDAQVIIPNAHAPIVSREDFEAVQRHMESRKKKRPKCKKHLFTNVAYCADCGQSLWYLKNRKGYVCGTHLKHGKHVCGQHTIKEEVLKSIILKDIRTWTEALNQRDVLERVEAKATTSRKQLTKQLDAVDKQLQKLNDERRALIRLLASDKITEAEYKDVTDDINSSIEQLQLKKSTLSNMAQTKGLDVMIARMKEELQRFMKLKDLTSDMLHRLVERIEVTADGIPQIRYRFALPSAFL